MSGQLGNVGELGDIGTSSRLSAHPGTTPERIDYDVHELAGPYYLAVIGHITQTAGTLYTLTVTIDPPVVPVSADHVYRSHQLHNSGQETLPFAR